METGNHVDAKILLDLHACIVFATGACDEEALPIFGV